MGEAEPVTQGPRLGELVFDRCRRGYDPDEVDEAVAVAVRAINRLESAIGEIREQRPPAIEPGPSGGAAARTLAAAVGEADRILGDAEGAAPDDTRARVASEILDLADAAGHLVAMLDRRGRQAAQGLESLGALREGLRLVAGDANAVGGQR